MYPKAWGGRQQRPYTRMRLQGPESEQLAWEEVTENTKTGVSARSSTTERKGKPGAGGSRPFIGVSLWWKGTQLVLLGQREQDWKGGRKKEGAEILVPLLWVRQREAPQTQQGQDGPSC